jgi:hypothetical protein
MVFERVVELSFESSAANGGESAPDSTGDEPGLPRPERR